MINILLPQNFMLTVEFFAATLAQANLITKGDFDNRPMSIDRKINSSKKSMFLLKINKKNYKHLI